MRKTLEIISLLFIVTTFCYSQWWPFIEQNSGTSANLTSGTQRNFGKIWVCGYNGTVLKTINTGANWINAAGNIPVTRMLVNICGINDSNIIVSGYTGTITYVYKTSNSGVNWTQVFTQSNGFIDAVWMRTATTGFMVGDPVGGRWSLWKTTNGGINWDSAGLRLTQAGSEAGYNNSLFCSGDYIWFGTNNSRIYYSTNYGLNWEVQPTSPVQSIYVIYRLTYFGGFFAGGSQLLESTNQGVSWNVVSNMPGWGNITGITEPNPGIINGLPQVYGMPMVSRQNKVYIYPYWLMRWDTIYTAPTNINYLFKVFSEPPGSEIGGCFAVRQSGGIAVCACQLTDVKSMSDIVPHEYKLYQNYPNPFNPVTKIKLDIPKQSTVNVVICDVLGKEIEVLVNGGLSPGTYEVDWDGTNYTSGVYFYKFITENYSETRKMVLIK